MPRRSSPWSVLVSTGLAALVAGCPARAPGPVVAYVPAAFECTAMNVARWRIAAPRALAEEPGQLAPAAGQMTEEAAKASRLFVTEHWLEAASALGAVALGAFGDDEGNRQIARYHLGIALYRQGRMRESAEQFSDIAAHPSHLKHDEALLWLGRLAGERDGGAFVAPHDFATYGVMDVQRFDNEMQRAHWFALSYLVAIGGLGEGGSDDAAPLLRNAASGGAYADAARRCLGAYGLR